MTNIRYEINCKPALILDTTLIKKVVASVPKQHPTLIVYVDPGNQQAFETQLENNSKVLGYSVDPRDPGTVLKEWKRT